MEQKSFMEPAPLRIGDTVTVGGRGGKVSAFGVDGKVQIEHIGDDGAYKRWYEASEVPGAKAAYLPQAVTLNVIKSDSSDQYQREIDRLQAEIDGLKLDVAAAESTADAMQAKYNNAREQIEKLAAESAETLDRLEEANLVIDELMDGPPVMEIKSWSDNPKLPNDAGLNALLLEGWRIKTVQIVVDERDFWRFVMLERVKAGDKVRRDRGAAQPIISPTPPTDDDPEPDDLPVEDDDELVDLYGETVITFDDEPEEEREPVKVYAGPVEVLTRDHPDHITFEDALKSGNYTADELSAIGDREALQKVNEKMEELRRNRKPFSTPEWVLKYQPALGSEVQS